MAFANLRAQGATEYLVLLAVVLLIALVGIALLSFFPATASDTEITQNQVYWQSATPISIIDATAKYAPDLTAQQCTEGEISVDQIEMQNTGPDQIYLESIVSSNGTEYPIGAALQPGQTACANTDQGSGDQCNLVVDFPTFASGGCDDGIAVDSNCKLDGTGVVSLSGFMLNYIAYPDGMSGVSIEKSFTPSKPLMVKCSGTSITVGNPAEGTCSGGDSIDCAAIQTSCQSGNPCTGACHAAMCVPTVRAMRLNPVDALMCIRGSSDPKFGTNVCTGYDKSSENIALAFNKYYVKLCRC
jgi:hypothetical protein